VKRLVFDVPKWNCFLHRDARGLEAASSWDKPLAKLEDELFDRLFAGDSELLPERKQDSNLRNWAKSLHQAFEQLPAFQRLAGEVRGDAVAAGAAVEALMNELKPTLPEPNHVDPRPLPRRTLGTACQKASEAVEELRDLTEGMQNVCLGPPGSGRAPGTPVASSSYRTLASRLREDDRLRRIALLAGRFKRIAAAKQRQKVKHGAEEVTDVEQGGELSRLLPAELAKLARPRLRLALLRDLLERQAMQYRLSGTETLGKGPLVACLDKSGSMDGAPDVWATAVALALLDIAQRQRRPFALLAFDEGVRFEAVVQPDETLPEQGLFVSCGGGTSIADVVGRGLELISQHPGSLRRADIVLITDGGSDPSPAPALREVAHELGVTILGIGIGVVPEVLSPWCDEIQSVSSVQGMDEATAEKLFTV
jgi:Mg-chelatase subunit ChlD